uniref:Uncharacterized protein n=1 Tax=Clastoptera arizonana TaxID=38151 RepID=A0A1B6E7P3_9HEMI
MALAKTNDRLICDIRLTVRKIKCSDIIQHDIIEDVFHIESDDLEREMRNYGFLTNSSKDLSLFLSEVVKKCSIEELREKLNHLKVWEIATKNETKIWKAYTLHNSLRNTDKFINDAMKMKKELLKSFHIKSLNAIINVICHENKLWCAITGRKLTRRSGIKMEKPVFICYIPESPYLFTYPNMFPKEKLERITRGLNFGIIKDCHLTGKNISSLLKMVEQRIDTNATSNITLRPGNEIEVGNRHVDFSRNKQTKHYIDRCFNKNIALQKFVAEAISDWRGVDLTEIPEGHFSTVMEVSSDNIAETFLYYSTKLVIKPPFPRYIKNFQYSGKNVVKLRKKY